MPMEIKVPQEVLDAIESNNINRRIHHIKRIDGTNCSKGKSAAMVITRRHTGWVYYCFRCKLFGEVPFDKNTPKQTLKLIAANKARQEMNNEKNSVALPKDYIKLSYQNGPDKARNWLWGYGIGVNMWKTYSIGWSDFYQRIIFPLIDDIRITENITLKESLVGWVARDVDFIKKENKLLENAPKYLIKTSDDDKRRFFMLNKKDSTKLIIVEDILSAIKVFEYGGNVNTLALLNTSIDNDLILSKYKKQTIKIWLDPDMRIKSVMNVARLKQFGFNVEHVYTMSDPKECSAEMIKLKCENK